MFLLKNFAVYAFANVLTAAVQFGIVFVFAELLGAIQFGQFSIYSVIYVVFTMVASLGLPSAVQHAYFHVSKEDYKVLISTTIKAILSAAIILGIIITLAYKWVSGYVNLPNQFVLLALVAATSQTIVQILLITLQCQSRASKFLLIVALQILWQIIFATLFYTEGQLRWESAAIAQALPPIFMAMFALVYFWRGGCRIALWSPQLLRSSLAYSSPLVPHQLATWGSTMADRLIIVNYVGMAQVGVYSFAFQLAQVINVASHSLNQTIVPILYQELASPMSKWTRIRRLNQLYALGLFVFSVFSLILVYMVFPRIFSDEYQMSLDYVPWLFFSFFLLAVSRIESNFLMYYKRTRQLATATVLSSILSVALNLILIPRFGAIAACWVSSATFSFMLLITHWYSKKCRPQV